MSTRDVKRKLAAILSTGVEACGHLPGDDTVLMKHK